MASIRSPSRSSSTGCEAIVEEMGEAMLRTSYSQILNSSRDFSTALCDADRAGWSPRPSTCRSTSARCPGRSSSVHDFFKGRIRPGDVFLLNDPYHGGNHLPDLTAFVPVFDGERLAFWSINRAHQSDIGGATHGAYNPGATEIWQEGIRITAAQALRPRRAARRRAADDRHQRAPPARLPRRPARR